MSMDSDGMLGLFTCGLSLCICFTNGCLSIVHTEVVRERILVPHCLMHLEFEIDGNAEDISCTP